MTSSSPRHRHFIAAPLAVVLLLAVGIMSSMAPVGTAYLQSRASGIVSSGDLELPFSSPSGTRGLLAAETDVSIARDGSLTLHRGSALFSADDGLIVDAGFDLRAESLDGTMFVLRDALSSTVAAVSGPVIAVSSSKIWILPQGYQLRMDASGASKRSRVPAAWLREQTGRSQAIPASVPDLTGPSLMTEAEVISALAPDTGALHRRILTALRLSTRLERLENDTAAANVASVLLTDPDALADLPFTVPALTASVLKPIPEGLLQGWVQSILRLGSDDTAAAALIIRDTAAGLPGAFELSGYPKQAMLWRDAIAETAQVLSPLLPETERAAFDLRISEAMRGSRIAASIDETLSSEAKPRAYTDEKLLMLTRIMLDAHGALFTPATGITPDAARADCARVTQIFIAENGRDTAYAFSYCPATETLAAIERDAKYLPNTVSVSAFFAH